MAKNNLPQWYLFLRQQFPDYIKSREALGISIRQAGPLDEKTVQL